MNESIEFTPRTDLRAAIPSDTSRTESDFESATDGGCKRKSLAVTSTLPTCSSADSLLLPLNVVGTSKDCDGDAGRVDALTGAESVIAVIPGEVAAPVSKIPRSAAANELGRRCRGS